MAGVISVSNETNSVVSRMTKDGRTLRYEMNVLQQPQRARACGSGAKSAADRRPVDPPPVVELRVYEVQGESKQDITFSHNANFFIYTTLESARAIAPGRSNALPPSFPVLTGMPVAGMAYLDRPSQAGYFIFPDLSVRHEGKYRLSFNLFEEVKDGKDADVDGPTINPEHPNYSLMRGSPMAPQAHVHFRLEVKSEPFVVFSAKKFPGLAESTHLSRVVADQGCRVRIRRDVRMRRRDAKPSKDYDDDDEPSYVKETQATPTLYTQQLAADRGRSISNVSGESSAPYAHEQRRPSYHEQSYYQPFIQPPSQQQQQQQAAPSHYNPLAPQYHTSPTSVAAAPQQSYPSAYQYPPPAPHRQSSSSSLTYQPAPAQQYQQQSYPPPQQCSDNEYRPLAEFRRSSLNSGSYYSHQPQTPTESRTTFTQPIYHSNQPAHPQHILPRASLPTEAPILPPLKAIQPQLERKYESLPLSNSSSIASLVRHSPTDSYHYVSHGTSPSSASQASSTTFQAATLSSTPTAIHHGGPGASAAMSMAGKRAFSQVFDSSHMKQSLHRGARPDMTYDHGRDVPQSEYMGTLVSVAPAEEDEDEDDDDGCNTIMSYRRADGRNVVKPVPTSVVA
ncbi:velvet protein [Agyrium rufum]|nr:velvet protein [Agyrium rufum]